MLWAPFRLFPCICCLPGRWSLQWKFSTLECLRSVSPWSLEVILYFLFELWFSYLYCKIIIPVQSQNYAELNNVHKSGLIIEKHHINSIRIIMSSFSWANAECSILNPVLGGRALFVLRAHPPSQVPSLEWPHSGHNGAVSVTSPGLWKALWSFYGGVLRKLGQPVCSPMMDVWLGRDTIPRAVKARSYDLVLWFPAVSG